MPDVRAWVADAVRRVEADAGRSADTHLHVLRLPETPTQALAYIEVYLKDESVHPTGSLKHRLARSLFLHALCSGWIGPDTTVVEASSGSTAVSEAYFARLIGLPFVAVMPAGTNKEKVDLIELYGGSCHLIDDPTAIYAEAQSVAESCGGHYLDQFSYAERATDWRGNNNIAETIFEQMAVVPPRSRRRDAAHPRRGFDRGDALVLEAHWSPGRRLHRDQPVGHAAARRCDAGC